MSTLHPTKSFHSKREQSPSAQFRNCPHIKCFKNKPFDRINKKMCKGIRQNFKGKIVLCGSKNPMYPKNQQPDSKYFGIWTQYFFCYQSLQTRADAKEKGNILILQYTSGIEKAFMRALPVAEDKQPASLGAVFAKFCKQQLGSKGKLYCQMLSLATAVTTLVHEEKRAKTSTYQKPNRTLMLAQQGINVTLIQHGACPRSTANPVMPTPSLEIKMDVAHFTKAIFSMNLPLTYIFFGTASEEKEKRK